MAVAHARTCTPQTHIRVDLLCLHEHGNAATAPHAADGPVTGPGCGPPEAVMKVPRTLPRPGFCARASVL